MNRWAEAPIAAAALAATSANAACVGLLEVSTPILWSLGNTRRIMSSVFAVRSANMFATPVIFPPGLAKLLTNPEPMGSLLGDMMIGIVEVARCATAIAGVASAI